ncbi:hypothetical protein HanPSC8_Chr01g0000531 [Helianthus annuus]|nr:hypothetical protein HanPSC8_Chr01g0000531 [Helianthus annuus]
MLPHSTHLLSADTLAHNSLPQLDKFQHQPPRRQASPSFHEPY